MKAGGGIPRNWHIRGSSVVDNVYKQSFRAMPDAFSVEGQDLKRKLATLIESVHHYGSVGFGTDS